MRPHTSQITSQFLLLWIFLFIMNTILYLGGKCVVGHREVPQPRPVCPIPLPKPLSHSSMHYFVKANSGSVYTQQGGRRMAMCAEPFLRRRRSVMRSVTSSSTRWSLLSAPHTRSSCTPANQSYTTPLWRREWRQMLRGSAPCPRGWESAGLKGSKPVWLEPGSWSA